MTDAPETPAIRAACDEMVGHIGADPCRWPECGATCSTLAKTVRATLATLPEGRPSEAQLQRVDAVLVAHCQAHGLSDISTWRLKHRVRKALTEG